MADLQEIAYGQPMHSQGHYASAQLPSVQGDVVANLPRVPDIDYIDRLPPMRQPTLDPSSSTGSSEVLRETFQNVQPSFVMPTEATDPFWGDDIGILFEKTRLWDCYPTSNQSLPERMNSISRLVLYVSVALAVYRKESRPLQYGVFLLFVLWILWKNQTIYAAENENPHGLPVENFSDVIDQNKLETMSAQKCTMPTLQNPFMNRLATDSPLKPPPCTGAGIQEMASNLLNSQLFPDPDDLFSKRANQRVFRTVPNEDRESFMNYLFKGAPDCKTDGICNTWNDLRRQRQLIPEDVEVPNVVGYNL